MRLAADAGFDGVAMDGGCFLRDLPALISEAAKVGLAFGAGFGPVAVEPLAKGKRLPHLVSLFDKEERQESLRLTLRNMDLVRGLGATRFVVDLGLIDLAVPEIEVRKAFSRCEFEDRDLGRRLLDQALAQRRLLSGRISDACQASLGPLLRHADAIGVRVLLMPAATPWNAPSSTEIVALLKEFSGAPLAPICAPAHRAALAELKLAGPSERWERIEREAGLSYATDAVGLARDLLPGLGELWAGSEGTRPCLPDAPVIISGRSDSTLDEVIAAKGLVSGTKMSGQQVS